jgi:phenylpropionate dioxygenase-like ring-hydroxylating dioxygenase large terminal subunit
MKVVEKREATERKNAPDAEKREQKPEELRRLIPETGLREYWYPAIAARKVGKRKPTHLKLLEIELALFRGKQGEVVALDNACPHRGAFLAAGDCHFVGTISCPYHGWTFDETGQCVAVLGEGPDSRLPGMKDARARVYPTKTLKGIVFVWMGASEPVPIEEDVPEEFFDEDSLIFHSVTTWNCNWRPAIENAYDAHVSYVHASSLKFFLLSDHELIAVSRRGPTRPRLNSINNRALIYRQKDMPSGPAGRGAGLLDNATKSMPYQEIYSGLSNAKWPKRGSRIHWHKGVRLFRRYLPRYQPLVRNEEWAGFHLPSTFRVDYLSHIYTRVTIPIDSKKSRMFYFHTVRPRSGIRKLYEVLKFYLWQNWYQNYNFSGQDRYVVENQRYDKPEKLSGTDIFSLQLRQLIVNHARGLTKRDDQLPVEIE